MNEEQFAKLLKIKKVNLIDFKKAREFVKESYSDKSIDALLKSDIFKEVKDHGK